MELSRNRFTNLEAFVSHANAALTPRARLRMARLIVEDGWPPWAAAKMFMVSVVTARKWAARLRAEGPAGIPQRTPVSDTSASVRQIVAISIFPSRSGSRHSMSGF